MRQDDRGITLIEMIIAIASSVIVMGAATVFIRNALRGYELAASTMNLNTESHVLVEQLSTWIMEGNYYAGPDSPSLTDGNTFIICRIPSDEFNDEEKYPDLTVDQRSELNGESWVRVLWYNGTDKLYMQEPVIPPTGIDDDYVKNYVANYVRNPSLEKTQNLVSDHVDEFNIEFVTKEDDDGVELPYKAIVTLSMNEYKFTNEVYMRNVVYGEQETTDDDP